MPSDPQAVQRLIDSIGNADESQGLEHWHHASGGRSDNGERDGVFVDRGEVIALIRQSELARALAESEKRLGVL